MFRLVEVNHEKDDVNSQGIIHANTMDEAIISFHRSMAYAMSNDKVLKASRNILNEAMGSVRRESYDAESLNEGDFYLVKKNSFVGGESTDSVLHYPNEKAARVAYHSGIADDMENKNVLELGYTILVDGMNPIWTENWTRPVEPEPEPEPEGE